MDRAASRVPACSGGVRAPQVRPALLVVPAGGFVRIHGTDQPEFPSARVSHGCIRMRHADILRLARLMPVGTPVTTR